MGAVVPTTFFALLHALRGSIAAIDRGEDPRWGQQVGWPLAMRWTCLPLLPPLAALVRRLPVGRLRVILHEGTEEHALERVLDLLARYVELT